MLRIQLRRAGQFSAIGFLLWSSASAASVTCELDAIDVFEAARDAGFDFALVKKDATSCSFNQSTIVVSAPQAKDASCSFELLTGRKPANGWRFTRLRYSASEGAEVSVTRLNPGWRIDVRSPRSKTTLVSISRVVARGKKCKDWEDSLGDEEERDDSDD